MKCSRYRPVVAQRMDRSIALLFHDRGTRRGWVVSSRPQPYFNSGKDPVPIVQEAGWGSRPVWTAENFASPGFDHRTVQHVVSRYTDWATGPILKYKRALNYAVLTVYNTSVNRNGTGNVHRICKSQLRYLVQ